MKKQWKKWLTKQNLAIGGGVLVSVFVVTGVSFALLTGDKPTEVTPDNQVVVDDAVKYRHPLTGALLDAGLTDLPQVFGVMIENSADAWPLSGVDEAFLVIEAPVEGNIPRFISFFSDEQDVEKIGPVRSARPYYIDWNDELDAVYTHVGGSPEALEKIRDVGTIDVNEFYQGEYFYRWNQRYAPHNAYTTSEELISALDELQLDDPKYDAWTFKEDAPSSEHAISICIDWPTSDTYDVCWDYDEEANAYVRKQGGVTVTTNNVVVMSSTITVVDAEGRRHITTVGTGDVLLLQDGNMTLGTWRKDERTSRLRFYQGEDELAMNAGSTWIEVVTSMSSVSTMDAKEAEIE